MPHQLLTKHHQLKQTHTVWIIQLFLLIPFTLLLYLYNDSVQQQLTENQRFSSGLKKVQQLSSLQEQIAQYRGLHHGQQLATSITQKNSSLLNELRSNIEAEIDTLQDSTLFPLNPTLIKDIRQRWKTISPNTNHNHFEQYTRLISLVQHLIQQVAISSTPRFNPNHPERTEIFALSTHTIPTLKEQMGKLRGLTYGALQSSEPLNSDPQFQLLLPIVLSEISTQRSLIQEQLIRIHQQNPERYTESFTLFSNYSVGLAALFELLKWEVERAQSKATGPLLLNAPDQLFQQVSAQVALLDQLTDTLFAHVAASLQGEQQQLTTQHKKQLTLLVITLIGLMLALAWVAAPRKALEQPPEEEQSSAPASSEEEIELNSQSSDSITNSTLSESYTEQIKILAVDDEAGVLDSYQALLKNDSNLAIEQLGNIINNTPSAEQAVPFILDCANTGERAVEMMRNAFDEGAPYQVVYLDMLMPGGWDGLKTAQELLQIDPSVRIIIISAWSDHSPTDLKPVLGNHFISLKKPFSGDELIQLTHYMAEDWRRTKQLTQSTESLSQIMEDLKESNEQRQRELDHQRIYQMILVTLSTSAPLYSGERQAGYNEVTQATLEALGVDRVTLWRLETEEGEKILVADDCYSVKEQCHQSGDRQRVSDYQEFWNRIEHRQVVRIDDTEPLSSKLSQGENYFLQHGIRALVIAPVFYNNQQIGIISAEVLNEPRRWKLEEATFLSYVSNLVPTIEISAERKDAEIQAENANKAKDDFLATMSHELRTPLSSMIGYGEILRETPLNQDQQELVSTMHLAGKTLLALVNDILDISKIEAGKFELDHAPFSLELLLHEMEMMFSPKAELNQIKFCIEKNQPLPNVQLAGDERRIVQILINLLGNALKFTNEGGVTLQISYESASPKASQQTGLFHFAVKDSGIGIAADTVDRLFRPFEQADGSISRSFGGTGLGLYISRVLAHLMEGEIQLQSTEGEGSTFTLSLPLELTDLPLPEPMSHLTPSNKNSLRLKGRVLIVEDTLELQQLEQRLVEATGVTVEVANDGEEALTMGLGGSYDLILMDMQMPKMDGITATQLLRSSSVNTPIVALTANVLQKHRDQFNAAGCNDFLSKPIDQSALRKVLTTYLEADNSTASQSTTSDSDSLPISDELTALFIERLRKSEQEIENHLAAESWDQLQPVIHTLKGAGSSFGYPEITQHAKSVELHLINKNYSEINSAVKQLLSAMQVAE